MYKELWAEVLAEFALSFIRRHRPPLIFELLDEEFRMSLPVYFCLRSNCSMKSLRLRWESSLSLRMVSA